MVKKFVTTALFLFLILINVSFANQGLEPKSNLKLLENILDSTLIELVESGVLNEQDSVIVQVVADDTTFSSIQKIFLNNLIHNKYGITVFYKPSKNNFFGKLLLFRWLEWVIQYDKIKHKFWQKQKYQRNLKADFFVEVFNRKDNKLLFSENIKKNAKSLIQGNDILRVQNPAYAFTMGQIKNEKGLLKKWVKPVFLFAISGAVIYLFYSVRTQ